MVQSSGGLAGLWGLGFALLSAPPPVSIRVIRPPLKSCQRKIKASLWRSRSVCPQCSPSNGICQSPLHPLVFISEPAPPSDRWLSSPARTGWKTTGLWVLILFWPEAVRSTCSSGGLIGYVYMHNSFFFQSDWIHSDSFSSVYIQLNSWSYTSLRLWGQLAVLHSKKSWAFFIPKSWVQPFGSILWGYFFSVWVVFV